MLLDTPPLDPPAIVEVLPFGQNYIAIEPYHPQRGFVIIMPNLSGGWTVFNQRRNHYDFCRPY